LFLLKQIKQFEEILCLFINQPVPLPRAFFTSLQKTQIKLIVTPNSKKTNTVVTIRNDQTLVVKIDGIISQQFKTPEPFRTVKKVEVSLTTEMDARDPNNKSIKYTDVKTSLEEPRNDYFNSNILVSFPYFGAYVITVDLCILDNTDTIWRYVADKQQIMVKVEEDPNRQKLFAAAIAAAANTNSGLATTSSNNNMQEIQQRMDF
jgi:hypothetical protein